MVSEARFPERSNQNRRPASREARAIFVRIGRAAPGPKRASDPRSADKQRPAQNVGMRPDPGAGGSGGIRKARSNRVVIATPHILIALYHDSRARSPPHQRSGRMTTPPCGRACKSGKPCSWDVGSCPVHGACEVLDMEREDRLSRLLQKGSCGAPTHGGESCENVRGDCPFHAAEMRCASCLDGDPARRCSNRKEDGSEHCALHAAFPNFGRILKGYTEECRSKGVRFSPAAFREACYPGASGLPPGNLHALVGTLLCLPGDPQDATESAGQSRPTSANLNPCRPTPASPRRHARMNGGKGRLRRPPGCAPPAATSTLCRKRWRTES